MDLVQQHVRSESTMNFSSLYKIYLLALCDFESVDLCGYVNDPTNVLDWKRVQAASDPSVPAVDVSYNSNIGHFAFLKGDVNTARISSRLITQSFPDTSGSCLRWYMILENSASLRIQTLALGAINPNRAYEVIGGKGKQWKLTRTTINSSRPFQIVFDGILNNTNNILDSIAIDDVELQSGPCGDLGFCDFERDLCGYQPIPADFEWKRTSFNIELFSAPQFDHTVNTRAGLNKN